MKADSVLKSLDYEVLSNIGKGAFGTVILAKSDRHPNQVAIKMMDRRRLDANFASTFLPRELTILKTVRHPHIIEVREIFEMPDGQVFIVMEAAVTDLLNKLLEVQRFPINQAKALFSQLLSAVGYLHQKNIAHRDLKCENVLLSADGQVKLTDFGLAGFTKGFPFLSRRFCGCLTYAAPEKIMNRPYNPKKADVWSLGVIFYIMVTGTLPFKTEDYSFLVELQRMGPAWFLSDSTVDKACRDFIAYMLHFNPFIRPSVKQVAQHPFLQSRQEKELSETADTALDKDNQQHQQQDTVEADGGEEDLQWRGHSASSDLFSSVMNAWGMGRDTVSSHQDSNQLQQKEEDKCKHLMLELADDRASQSGQSELDEKDYDCSSSKFAHWVAIHIAAPICRAAKAFKRRMRKTIRVRKSSSANPGRNFKILQGFRFPHFRQVV